MVVKSTVSTSWTLQLIGDSHDLRWYMEVGTFSNHYRGPGTYSSDAGDVKGHLDANDRTRNYWGGGALRGGSLTVGPDERSGSFDVTLRAGVNSRLEPSNTVRMTGSFSCSDLRAF